METLAEKIDAILRSVQNDLPSGCSEMSEFAEGIDTASAKADALIEHARARISALFDDEKEPK